MIPAAATTIADFCEALAAKTPAPGGGAVAGVLAALAASLAAMVVAYSHNRPELAGNAAQLTSAANALQAAARAALDAADADAAAFSGYQAARSARKRGEGTDDEVRAHAARVVAVPRALLAEALRLLDLIDGLCGRTNERLASDLAVAAATAEAAVSAAGWNLSVNLGLIDSEAERQTASAEIAAARARAAQLRSAIEQQCGPSGHAST